MKTADLFALLDVTSLDSGDHSARIRDMVHKLDDWKRKSSGALVPASVCVFPEFLSLCGDYRKAAVAGAFPMGVGSLEIKMEEIRIAFTAGADEIDYVIHRGHVFSGDWEKVREEARKARETCGDKILKVILETGELKDPALISRTALIWIEEGTDFLKTSTGKIYPGADPVAVRTLAETIRQSGSPCGIKISGGVTEVAQALEYIQSVASLLGESFIQPKTFRIGASRLAERLAEEYLTGI